MKIEQFLKGFHYPDQRILSSKVYADLPEHFLTLKAAWQGIKAKLQSYMVDLGPEEKKQFFEAINSGCAFESVEEFIVKTCWGWKPSGRTVRFRETERLGQHCFGYMYTSDSHAWPMHGNIPYLPLIQIDLDKAGELIGADVGDGLLQLFEAPMVDEIDVDDWYLLRHIPKEEISRGLLTDFPDFSDAEKSEISEQYIHPDYEGLFGESSASIIIDDFDVKSLGFCEYLANASDEALFSTLEEQFPKVYEGAKNEIERYRSALTEFCNAENTSYDGDATLFGFEMPIQAFPRDLDCLLLKFGGFRNRIRGWYDDSRTNIYGDGSGAIYVKFEKNGEPNYYFYGSR